MTPVDVTGSPMMSLKSSRPWAPSNPPVPLPLTIGVLAAPAKLYPVIILRLKLVRCRARAHGSAVEAANEDLFAAFQVHAAWRFLTRNDLRIPAAFEAARHHKSRITGEIRIPRRRGRTLHRVEIYDI